MPKTHLNLQVVCYSFIPLNVKVTKLIKKKLEQKKITKKKKNQESDIGVGKRRRRRSHKFSAGSDQSH